MNYFNIVFNLLFIMLSCNGAPKTPLHVLVLVPMDTSSQRDDLIAISMATKMINSHNSILRDYELVVHYRDTKRSRGHTMNLLYKATQEIPPCLFVIGPVEEDTIDDVKDYLAILKINMITYGTNMKNEYDYKYIYHHHRVAPGLETFSKIKRIFLKHFHWKRAAVFFNYVMSKSSDSVINQLKNDNITIVVNQDYFPGDKITLSERMKELKNKDARIIIAEIGPNSAGVFCEVHKQNLKAPRFVWILRHKLEPNWYKNHSECTANELLEAANYHFAFDFLPMRRDDTKTIANITANEYTNIFNREVENRSNSLTNEPYNNKTSYGAYAFDSMWLMALTLQNSIDDGSIRNVSTYKYRDWEAAWYISLNIKKIMFEGLTGSLSLTNYGFLQDYRENDVLIYQFREGLYHEVGIYNAKSESIQIHDNQKDELFIGDVIPKDKMTIIEIVSTYDDIVVYSIFTFTTICIALSIFFLVVNIVYDKHKVIRMSSPNVNSIILCGSFLAYISIILNGINAKDVDHNQNNNEMNGWLGRSSDMCLSLGFTLTFGGFFAKTWRVYKIFTASAKLKRTKSLSRNMILLLFCFVILDVVLLTSWNILSPFTMQKKILSQTEDVIKDVILVKYFNTATSPYETEFYAAFLGLKGLMLVFGLFLAWQTRIVSIDVLNDSKSIGLAVYNVSAISIVGVISLSALKGTSDPQLVYIVLSLCVGISTVVSMLLVFVPKVMLVFGKNEDNQPDRTKSTFTLSTSTHSVYRSDAQSYTDTDD